MSGVHTNDLLAVGDQAPVQPDVAAVIDAGESQQVGLSALRGGELSAVPPIPLIEILRHVVAKILTYVQIRIDTVFSEYLQYGGRHSADLVPRSGVIVRKRQGVAVDRDVLRWGQRPIVRKLKALRRSGPSVTGDR